MYYILRKKQHNWEPEQVDALCVEDVWSRAKSFELDDEDIVVTVWFGLTVSALRSLEVRGLALVDPKTGLIVGSVIVRYSRGNLATLDPLVKR